MSRPPLVHVDQPLAGLRSGARVSLTADERHHLVGVLRLRAGDRVEVSDGAGAHAAGRLADDAVTLDGAASVQTPPRPPLHVVHALPKGRKLDEVVRACVELGVDGIVPVAAARSVRRPEGTRADRAVGRWSAVARSACEQARRLHRPTIASVCAPRDLVVEGVWLLAHPAADAGLPSVLDELRPVRPDVPVTIAIGPEGGWSDDEVAYLSTEGARPVRLGPTVLRTEHAAAAAVAVLAAWCGRWS